VTSSESRRRDALKRKVIMNTKQIAAELCAWGAGLLTKYKPTLLAAAPNLNASVDADGVKIIEAADSKLPLGLGAALNAGLATATPAIEAQELSLESDGYDGVVEALTKVATAAGVTVPTL
jgi:hypothetical protein